MKKLLIVTQNLEDGGGQNMILELVKNIDQTRYQVAVLCCRKKNNTKLDAKINNTCKVFYGDLAGKIVPGDFFRIWRIISKYNPDIMHAHFGGVTFAISWGLLHKVPTVVTVHTTPSKGFSKNNQKLIQYGLKKGLAYIVAVSAENCDLCRNYYKLEDDKCLYVNNGVDIDKYYRKPHGKFTLINVARQDDNKNQEKIIRAFSRLLGLNYDIKLILVGDGPKHGHLKKLAANNNALDRIQFTGLVGDPENYYAVSDVYVQSSHREAMPMSILEAMATGLPIVSTNVGGVKDVIRGNGYLIDDTDEESFFHAIKTICDADREEYAIMSEKSKEIVKDFSAQEMSRKYMSIYDYVRSVN